MRALNPNASRLPGTDEPHQERNTYNCTRQLSLTIPGEHGPPLVQATLEYILEVAALGEAPHRGGVRALLDAGADAADAAQDKVAARHGGFTLDALLARDSEALESAE